MAAVVDGEQMSGMQWTKEEAELLVRGPMLRHSDKHYATDSVGQVESDCGLSKTCACSMQNRRAQGMYGRDGWTDERTGQRFRERWWTGYRYSTGTAGSCWGAAGAFIARASVSRAWRPPAVRLNFRFVNCKPGVWHSRQVDQVIRDLLFLVQLIGVECLPWLTLAFLPRALLMSSIMQVPVALCTGCGDIP